MKFSTMCSPSSSEENLPSSVSEEVQPLTGTPASLQQASRCQRLDACVIMVVGGWWLLLTKTPCDMSTRCYGLIVQTCAEPLG